MTTVDTCMKIMENLSLPQDPTPSSLFLQGERGSSRSSSELSSSEGVWLVRKWKENERKREKVKPKTGELKASPKKNYCRKLLILHQLD